MIWITPLGSELKKQTSILGKQYWELIKVYKFDKQECDDKIRNKE